MKRDTGWISWTTEGTATHPIPIDTNGNKIADGWENDANNNYSNDADDEDVPTTTFSKWEQGRWDTLLVLVMEMIQVLLKMGAGKVGYPQEHHLSMVSSVEPVKKVQTRSFRIEAINSAGSAYSEWIKALSLQETNYC